MKPTVNKADINGERLELALEAAGLDLWENDLLTGEIPLKATRTLIELGYSEAEALHYMEDMFAIVHPEDAPMVKSAIGDHLAGLTDQYRCEFRLATSSGAWVWYANYGKIMDRKCNNSGCRFIGVTFNIDDRKRKERELTELNQKLGEQIFERNLTEKALIESEKRFKTLANGTFEGIAIIENGLLIDVNNQLASMVGYDRCKMIGQLAKEFIAPENCARVMEHLRTKIDSHIEFCLLRKDGSRILVEARGNTIEQDGLVRKLVSLRDITMLKQYQQELERSAYFDTLTGLPNRAQKSVLLRQAITHCQHHSSSLAVAYIDLDGFKVVNDNYGHKTGDDLLIALSQRMQMALRDGDTLARIGGDEFVVVMANLETPSDCEPVLQRLLQAAALPVKIAGLNLQVSASIGVAIYPTDSSDADLLIRHADQAMYQAKRAGKNRYHLFDVAQDAAIQNLHDSLAQIRHALDNNEFVLYYQPKVNMKTGRVIGAEALIRWEHPERGLLPPAAFLPLIEDHDISLELGAWVINTALNQISEWQSAGLQMSISVNVGARQLQKAGFSSLLRAQLSAHPEINPAQLELEILETSAFEDLAQVSEIMRVCQAMGVQFSLDDFGTGYSSLTYLKHLSADTLKIDQSFVRDMLEDMDDLSIVEGVLGLARAFRRNVIAEGVETIAHGTLLLSYGCELAQGYGIAHPMPASALPAWVAAWRPNVEWENTRKS